jgi:hypothetical protein
MFIKKSFNQKCPVTVPTNIRNRLNIFFDATPKGSSKTNAGMSEDFSSTECVYYEQLWQS